MNKSTRVLWMISTLFYTISITFITILLLPILLIYHNLEKWCLVSSIFLSQGVPRLLGLWGIFSRSESRRQFETFYRALGKLANQNSVFFVIRSELSDPDRHTDRQTVTIDPFKQTPSGQIKRKILFCFPIIPTFVTFLTDLESSWQVELGGNKNEKTNFLGWVMEMFLKFCFEPPSHDVS